MTREEFRALDIAILGGGLAGLSCAIALRRLGHKVKIYERNDYSKEVGASLSCASNGGKWLHEWGIDPQDARPVILRNLIRHNWETGAITGKYELGDYAEKFGYPYYNFHRIDIHTLLKATALSEKGAGTPCELLLNHKAIDVNYEDGQVVFENGNKIRVDLIVAADGIRSTVKPQIGITPKFKKSDSSCIRVLINGEIVKEMGLTDFSQNDAIEFWGGENKYKIVMSPCSKNEVVSCYCFYEAMNGEECSSWDNEVSADSLIKNLPGLDPQLRELFLKAGYDIKQWRLYVHEPLPYFYKVSSDESKGVVLIGDAAHAMMPDQSQGAVAAFEDSGALGYIFSSKFNMGLKERLEIYEKERKPRVTEIQAASLKARENLNERIGWSSQTTSLNENKLTIEKVCGYNMKSHIDELILNNNGII